VYFSKVLEPERRGEIYRGTSKPDYVLKVLSQIFFFTNINLSPKSTDSIGQLHSLQTASYILKNCILPVWVQMERDVPPVNVNTLISVIFYFQ